MNTVTVSAGELVITPRGLNKIWGFRRELRVPLSHVTRATADTSIGADPPALRLLGLSLPGKHVGTFFRHGEHSYWNISDRVHNVVVEFVHEGFARAVLTVEEPTDTARAITAAIQ
ncbi:hypothetical protein [Nesterenkonia lutea]|uniref:Uncharacterized protein n=1 Tax=Nesterenkonia lutea TaxID=272919 RepID=A0ABR9JE02_9MICC|nr:hypothetical protein [Nesterenkonia lutea]MBE1523993.1 hypothetical protein [Nesterenkonia lutea]